MKYTCGFGSADAFSSVCDFTEADCALLPPAAPAAAAGGGLSKSSRAPTIKIKIEIDILEDCSCQTTPEQRC